MIRKYFFLVFALLIFTVVSDAQTIHKNNIENLKFCLNDNNLIIKENTECEGKDIYHFYEWQNQATKIEESCSWWPFAKPYKSYRFYIFRDGKRWGRSNVLTTWETVGNDSLKFRCSKQLAGHISVKKVSVFWDGSLVILTEGINGDVDFIRGEYAFLYGTPCNLEKLYERVWEQEEGPEEVDTYIYYDVHCPLDQITETTEFSSIKNGKRKIDSANVKIINLYEMAVEHFGIDTLK